MLNNLKLLVLEEPDPFISELLFTVSLQNPSFFLSYLKFVNAIIRVLTNKQMSWYFLNIGPFCNNSQHNLLMFEAINHEGSFHNNETITFFFKIRTCPALTHTQWSLDQMRAQTCITKHLFKNMFMKVESLWFFSKLI